MTALKLFLPLTKVDLDQRLVTGVATAETPDRSGEICDYASSKPYFEKWSAEALAASGGKSLGAVRAMHGPIAAGKLTDIGFDDDERRVVVKAKIVDDDEWRKVTEGVYTGFSQGGRYVKRWPDEETGLVRYTAEPREISLVDLPCLPDATFEVVKDGVVEKRAFATAERREAADDGVAMPDGAYPIASTEDVENAVRDYDRSGRRPEVKAHIVARARAIGAESALPDDWTAPEKAAAAASFGRTFDEAGTLAKAASALVDAAQKLESAADTTPGCARRSTPSRRRSTISSSASPCSKPSRCPPKRRCGRCPRALTGTPSPSARRRRSGASRPCRPTRARSRSPSSASPTRCASERASSQPPSRSSSRLSKESSASANVAACWSMRAGGLASCRLGGRASSSFKNTALAETRIAGRRGVRRRGG